VTAGRPPAPLEHHRRVGRQGAKADGRPLPALSETQSLEPAILAPTVPAALDDAGAALWEAIWSHGLTWISPQSDLEMVMLACVMADDLSYARRMARTTRDDAAKWMAQATALGRNLQGILSELGMSPTARARLGVAEVKAKSILEQMAAKRQNPQ
jgi:phage terminase small subunit